MNDFWSPFAGAITAGPTYDLFGFSAGMLGDTSLLNIQIVTNLNTYFYNGLVAPNVRAGMDFFGFKASAGEYFTGFRLTSSQGSGSAPAITDVQLGNTSPVPEPSFYGVLGFGVIALVFARKFSSRSVPDSQ
ncbi:MAG: PEP-CTERM sorting domain-containing protein [Bryobacterales bacterium]|nr:PEP-CTERM sorting domain-containing protein [Bryobacterales bacterium]